MWCHTEAGYSGNQQSDTDEPMGTGEEAEHMCVLVYGGFSGDAVEGDLISIDPGIDCSLVYNICAILCLVVALHCLKLPAACRSSCR